MARKKYVTRTMESTVVTVLGLNLDTAEPSNTTVTINGKYKDEESILKVVKPLVETDNYRVVAVTDKTIKKLLIKQEEQHFIANADIVEEL